MGKNHGNTTENSVTNLLRERPQLYGNNVSFFSRSCTELECSSGCDGGGSDGDGSVGGDAGGSAGSGSGGSIVVVVVVVVAV